MKTKNNRHEDKIKKYGIVALAFMAALIFLILADYHFSKRAIRANRVLTPEDEEQLLEMKSFHRASESVNIIFF